MQKDVRKHITRVKICCISNRKEAELAIRYGAHAIGLVSEMPSGPGVIPEELIAEIAAATPPGVRANDKLDEAKRAAFMDAVRSRNATKVWRL